MNTTLLLLATLFLLQGRSSILITANITFDDSSLTVVPSQKHGGRLAPPFVNQTREYSSCNCGRILLSSLGQAAQYQPDAMGYYDA